MITREQFQESFQKVVEETKAQLRAALHPMLQEAVNEYCLENPEIDHIEIDAEHYFVISKEDKPIARRHRTEVPDVLDDMLFEASAFMCGLKIYNNNGK